MEELELRVLVAADRDGVGADSGATSAPVWLAHATRTSRSAAFADLHLSLATGLICMRQATSA